MGSKELVLTAIFQSFLFAAWFKKVTIKVYHVFENIFRIQRQGTSDITKRPGKECQQVSMNYAVNSATAVYQNRRLSFQSLFKIVSPQTSVPVRRITINVGGERFQTYEETLDRYPRSLLGSRVRRQEFYDITRDELVFPHRNKEIFNAILFFYQAKILSRPDHIPRELFADEIDFFGLMDYCNERLTDEREEIIQTYPENNTLRNRVWNFFENPETKQAHAFAKINLVLVFVWIVINCTETHYASSVSTSNRTGNGSGEPSEERTDCDQRWDQGFWFIINTLFVVWFSIDYVIHIFSAPNVLRYILSASGLIDLVTILPYYLELIAKHTGTSLSPQMKALMFLRVFRLFKASRYSSSFRILVGSLTSSAHDFPVWFLLIIMHIFFFSSILFYVEREVENPQFSHIPDVMWFTVITMCAVGYGDVVPKSSLGKLVTAMAAVSGIVIVYCIPAPTLKSNFIRLNALYKSKKKRQKKCLKMNGVHRVNHYPPPTARLRLCPPWKAPKSLSHDQ